jgi:hypothetical protein
MKLPLGELSQLQMTFYQLRHIDSSFNDLFVKFNARDLHWYVTKDKFQMLTAVHLSDGITRSHDCACSNMVGRVHCDVKSATTHFDHVCVYM